jgi:predicted Zn-dependent peptidase
VGFGDRHVHRIRAERQRRQWIALASDVLLNPSFPESELDKLKQRMKVQLQQQRSTAGS